MKNIKLINILFVFLIFVLSLSCKTREKNYITYYQKVNEIDSVYRIVGQSEIAAKEYKKLFRKYEPKNQKKIEEYATYIMLADRYNINFGGKKSLRKLIHFFAPGAHENWHKPYYPLLKKYGIDSLEVEKEIALWRKGLNKELLDSFSIAMERDQAPREMGDLELAEINEKINFNLLKWTFERYGYPSEQKIGIRGNYDRSIHISTILYHLADTKKEYEYLKIKLLEYVKLGECPPEDYALLVDIHESSNKRKVLYLMNANDDGSIDSANVNKNRKEIGMPSILHSVKIRQDFWKKMETNYDSGYNRQ